MTIIGSLLCDECPSQRIPLGTIPGDKQDIQQKDGTTITITHPAETVTISSVLRDVVAIDDGVATLSCGHRKIAVPLWSLQEWVQTDDGQIVQGVGLATFRKGK